MKSKTFDQRVATKRDRLAVAKPDRAKRRKELIERFEKGCDMVGSSLQELHDDKHWQDTHTSWVSFCREVLGISKTKAWKMLRYTEVVAGLSTQNQPKITNMEQALALLKVPEKDRDKVISKAENNGGITADNLRFHAAKPVSKKRSRNNVTSPVTDGSESEPSSSGNTELEMGSKPKNTPSKKDKIIVFDKVGTIVPEDALPYWEKRQLVQDVLTEISRLKSAINKSTEGVENLWSKHKQHGEEYLTRAYSYLSDALPHAVCLQCQGSFTFQPEGCSVCGNTGFISEYRFDHYLPKELREIRMRANQDLAKQHSGSPLNKKPS